MKKYLLYSFFIHVSILFLLGLNYVPSSNEENSGGDKNIGGEELIPKIIEVSTVPNVNINDCDNWYGGVGITVDSLNCITTVSSGYVADRSGIIVGDCITSVSDPSGEIRGEIGTSVTLVINRLRNKKVIKLIREKICVR